MNEEEKKTILIFQKPDNYFFPALPTKVFAPYERKEKNILYYLYRIANLLKLPFSHFFWGNWKKEIPTTDRVIIFDYGYQNGMEKYIKRINPDCEVYLFCWNKINNLYPASKNFSFKGNIYATDKNDCQKYGLKYNHIFYTDGLISTYCSNITPTAYFVGSDRGRGEYIRSIKKVLKECGIICNIHIYQDSSSTETDSDTIKKTISYPQYVDGLKKCNILLDIYREGQTALTLRAIESIFFSKKLITNNADIVNYSFYNENNILLISEEAPLMPETVSEFLEKPFVHYSDDILSEYGFKHWLNSFNSEAK